MTRSFIVRPPRKGRAKATRAARATTRKVAARLLYVVKNACNLYNNPSYPNYYPTH